MPAKVRLLKGKYWCVEINHEGESRKLTQWMNQKFATEEMARFFEGAINNQILTGLFRWDAWFPRLRQKYLLKEAYWKWLEHKPLAPSTYTNRVFAYQHFRHMEDRDVRELRSTDFAWIRETHGDTPKAQAIRSKAQAFLNWFHRAEGTDKRVDLMPIQVPRKETPYLPIDTRWKILDMMQEPYRDPTLLAIETGMRIGEILALQWGDIDWEGRGIDVRHTLSGYQLKETRKSGDQIWIPWQGKANDLFDRLRPTRQLGGFVFTHPTGSRIWPQQLSPAFKAVCRSLGLPRAKFHHLRNSFLHDLSEAGATTKEAGALAGHRSERTTERYIGRWSKEKVRQIASLRGGKNERDQV